VKQTRNDVVDVVDSEHDAAYAQRVRRRACRLGSDRRRRVELRQLEPAVAVRVRIMAMSARFVEFRSRRST
jgi:hypothetical protein